MIRCYWTTVFGELHGHGRTTRQDRGQMGRVMLAQVMNATKAMPVFGLNARNSVSNGSIPPADIPMDAIGN